MFHIEKVICAKKSVLYNRSDIHVTVIRSDSGGMEGFI